jgi:hypothetical protein
MQDLFARQLPLIPARTRCEICGDSGSILIKGRPKRDRTVREILRDEMPCACEAGDKFRELAREFAKPILDRDGNVIEPGVEVDWLKERGAA